MYTYKKKKGKNFQELANEAAEEERKEEEMKLRRKSTKKDNLSPPLELP